jgi:hypothetical protein
MKTIADFYNDVRGAIGRGTVNDALFPMWAHEALNMLENMSTFTWQKRTYEFPLLPALGANRIALVDENDVPLNIKAFNWAKFGVREGVGSGQTTMFGPEITLVDPRQLVSIGVGFAQYAYMDGANTLVLDETPQEASTLFAEVYVYTQWDDYDTDETPDVLARHYSSFKAVFMMTAAANLRDGERLGAIWSGMSERGIAAMIAADTDFQWKARRKLRMGMSQP